MASAAETNFLFGFSWLGQQNLKFSFLALNLGFNIETTVKIRRDNMCLTSQLVLKSEEQMPAKIFRFRLSPQELGSATLFLTVSSGRQKSVQCWPKLLYLFKALRCQCKTSRSRFTWKWGVPDMRAEYNNKQATWLSPLSPNDLSVGWRLNRTLKISQNTKLFLISRK